MCLIFRNESGQEENYTCIRKLSYPAKFVRADKDRIQQVIENLIVNSIKYGKTNGTTEVAVVNDKRKVLIRISDNGGNRQAKHTKVI
jgi:signal transduction histidine kinase